jgi:hypothetical protein
MFTDDHPFQFIAPFLSWRSPTCMTKRASRCDAIGTILVSLQSCSIAIILDVRKNRGLREELNLRWYRFLGMKKAFLVIIPLTLVLCVLIGGCVQSSSPAPVTPTPSVPVTPSQQLQPANPPLDQTCSLEPGPTQVVPDFESVSVTVNRNPITENPTIDIVFDGGLGLGMVQRMNVTVIRSDCVTEQGTRNNPVMGETVTLMGTTLVDRVIVVMTMTSGEQYTIIDDDFSFLNQV